MSRTIRGMDLGQIRRKIACPQLGDNHYGEWGGLPLEVRLTINGLVEDNKWLCGLVDMLMGKPNSKAILKNFKEIEKGNK